MDEYIRALESGGGTGLYGRITRGVTAEDFAQLSQDPTKRLSWVFNHETLRRCLGMSHLDMLIHSGHTLDWIRHQLNAGRQFKLIICSLPPEEVKLATWDGIFQLLAKVYPEIDPVYWTRHADELKRMALGEIDPEGTIVKNYYLGPTSEGYMHTERFVGLKDQATLLHVRAFLHNQIGLNELFRGDGRTLTDHGVLGDEEYLTLNRPLHELKDCALLDLHPILLF